MPISPMPAPSTPAPLRAPRLCGLRLAVADEAAAASTLARVFALPAERRDGARWPRLQLADQWIEVRGAPGDTLDLQCDDLAQQRTHLQRLGIEALDGAALGCTPCLRLEMPDTGACTVDLHPASPPREGHTTAPAVRLCGIELAVRSPERVALHWAQLFHARTLRDAQGQPALALDGLQLRFALAADGHSRITTLEFGVVDMGAAMREAAAHGMHVRHHDERRASFHAPGFRVGLRAQP